MKTYRLLLIAAALIGSAALLPAGPSPQFPSRPATPKSAPTTILTATGDQAAPMVAACATCACCKKSS